MQVSLFGMGRRNGNKSRFIAMGIAMLGLLLNVHSARADLPAFTIDNTTGEGLGNPPFTLGFEFSTSQAITVTGLGVFDDSQDGLSDSYSVGLFDSVGDLLASTTVDSGTTDSLINQFRYKSITPLALTAGTYTVGALYADGNDGLLFPGDASGFAASSPITFIQSAFAFGGGLSFPGSSAGSDPSYFGPNFTFTAASTPLPSTLWESMMLLALLGGWKLNRHFAAA